MEVVAFEVNAIATDQLEPDDRETPVLGLVGEIGSLVSALKKKRRDTDAYFGYHEVVTEELGDVLWYLSAVARRGGTSLAEVFSRACGSESENAGGSFNALTGSRSAAGERQLGRSVLSLSAEAGDFAKRFVEGAHSNNPDAIRGDLIKLLRPLTDASIDAGVSLAEAASANVAKTLDRWPVARVYPASRDQGLHVDERLPERMRVLIYERDVSGTKYVFQKCGENLVGDRLTDNHLPPDDYRFHDVFHLAHAAVLRWSPTTRALLRIKRKSDKHADENEDGARANLIEEGLTTWIFEIAKRHQFFANTPKLGFDLLKGVKQFVRGYEAESLPMWLWESAILQGYSVFRSLKECRQGAVVLDGSTRRIYLEKMTTEEKVRCGLS